MPYIPEKLNSLKVFYNPNQKCRYIINVTHHINKLKKKNHMIIKKFFFPFFASFPLVFNLNFLMCLNEHNLPKNEKNRSLKNEMEILL